MSLDCVILAAGSSQRFGGCKLLADWHGRPLIAHAIEVARSLAPQRLLVVTGAFHQTLEPILRQINEPSLQWSFCPDWADGMGASLAPQHLLVVTGAFHQTLEPILRQINEPSLQWSFCPDWADGMGASLAFGASQLADDNGLLVMLADTPLVTAADLVQLQKLWRNNPHKIICSRFGDTLSVPTIFPAEFKTELGALRGDKGAKALFSAHSDLLLSLPLPAAEFDVDTPADLARLLQESSYDFAQD